MSGSSKHIVSSPVAKSTPYDDQLKPTNLGSDVQTAIDNLYIAGAVSASPGYTWGHSGTATPGSWFVNDTVPSNKTGRNFSLYNGYLDQISVASELPSTFTIDLYEHDGVTFTLLASTSLVAQRSKIQNYTGVNLTYGKELAIQLSAGSAKNIVVQVVARGTVVP